MISPGRVLQKYLFEHHTIPVWNLYLCGGQYELQNPQSFTLTWPSAFQYLMQPAVAIMCLWLVMTIAGTWATARLLLLAGTRSWIAWACALAFTLSGYFGAHFNQGHATFAFFHLVPLMCLAMVHEWRNQFTAGKSRTVIPSLVVLAFLLFSAPAIQALVYALPAFIVLAAVLFTPSTDRNSRLADHAGFVAGVLTSCVLGVLMAGYKFLPVLFQAMSRRRDDIFRESYGPSILLKTMFAFVSRPHAMWNDFKFEGRIFGWWEFTAFVSPVLVIVAIGAPFFVWNVRDFYSSLRRRLLAAGMILMVTGCVLTLGNSFWLDLTSDAQSGGPLAKFLQSVRVFPRFQFLSLFGMSLCAGITLECLANRFTALGKYFNLKPTRALVLGLIAGPSVIQSAVMIYDIKAIPDRFMEQDLGVTSQLDQSSRTGVPMLSRRLLKMPGIISVQDLMIRRGVIVDQCYDQFFPIKPEYQVRGLDILRPITSPPVGVLAGVTGRSFELKIPANLDSNLVLNMALVDQATIDPQPFISRSGIEFEREKVAGRSIRVEFPVDDVPFGFTVSLIALGTTALLMARSRMRLKQGTGVGVQEK